MIELSVSALDSDLLLAVDWDISAGDPGQPGKPGSGGDGGSGGAGGDSYSWTETEWYTDSEGKRKTRSRMRSNSGGSRGRSGSDGAGGSPGRAGSPAADGRFSLTVDGRSYRDRYALRCLSYQVVSGDSNNVLEFGEKNNRVVGTVIKNTGPAPSPPSYVSGRLQADQLATPHEQSHPLPALTSDRQTTFPDFSFDLDEAPERSLPTIHEVLKTEVRLTPRLWFERLQRVDPDCELLKVVNVTFPVALETVNASTSLVRGQWLKQQWKVVNRTNNVFPPPGRKVLVDLALTDDHAHLIVQDSEGRSISLQDGHTFAEIAPMEAGESATLSVLLKAGDRAEPYCKSTLCATLRLTPQGGGAPRCIQQNPTRYSVAIPHDEGPADVLLVTHHGSSRAEFQAWQKLFETLSLSFQIWDVSLYGELPLKRLAKWYAGKLVVVLNTPLTTPHRHTVFPTQLADLDEFRSTVAEDGFSYYFVGERSDVLNHLVPHPSEVRTFDSPTEYLKKGDFSRAPGNAEVPREMTQRMDKVAVSRFFVKGQPKPEYLLKTARKLIAKLREKSPQDRFHITTVFEPAGDEGWLKTKKCGVLEVRRLPDHDARSVVTRKVYRETGQKESFLHSAENLLGLFSALDMNDKLGLIQRLKDQSNTVLEALADAVLLDLTEEQLDLRQSEVRLSSRQLAEALNRTVEFCAHDFGRSVQPESPIGQVIVRVAAGLEFLARHQMAWWDHRIRFLFGGSNNVEITNFTRGQIDALLDRTFGKDRLWRTGELREKVESLLEQRRQELEQQRAQIEKVAETALDKKETAVEALVRWELRDYLETDAEADSTICSQLDMDTLKSIERAHRARCQELKDVYRDALEAGRA